jgi:signal transduction histidine kinase
VTVRLQKINGHAVVEVEDTGCGMDEAFIRARLFRPFQTTKGDSGMGIGVYEAREFVRSLGGDIVRSKASPARERSFAFICRPSTRRSRCVTQDRIDKRALNMAAICR